MPTSHVSTRDSRIDGRARGASAFLVLTTFYVAAKDRPLPPKPHFAQIVETFIRPLQYYPQTIFAPYVSGTDSTLVRSQFKAFSQPEVFVQPQGKALVVTLTTYSPYNPTIDAKRLSQSSVFSSPEAFVYGMPYSQVIINGTAAPVIISTFYFRGMAINVGSGLPSIGKL